MWIVLFIVVAVVLCCAAWAVTTEHKGKRYPLTFRVKHGPTEAYELAGLTEVTDFLQARGLITGSPEWEAALAGHPIEFDGTTVQFIPVSNRVA